MAKRGNGDGTYLKRADGRWEAKLTLPNGNRKSVYGRTRQETKSRADELMKRSAQGLDVLSRDQTFGTYIGQWLTDVVGPALRPTTYESYELIIRNRITPNLGKVKLSAVTPQQLQALYKKLADNGLAPATIVRTHAVLHGALKQAMLWNLIPRNPADAVRPPAIPRAEMKVLDRDQVNKLLEAAPDETSFALYSLAAMTGLRRGELLGLKWVDVNFERAQLTVQRTAHRIKGRGVVMGEPKTNAGRRSVRLGSTALAALRRQRAYQLQQRLSAGPAWVDQGLIFANTVGSPLEASRVTRKFQDTLFRASLPKIRFHDLRHTAATLLIEQGVTIKAVQATMGHSTIATTMDVYAHVTPAMQDSVAEAMDRLFATPD